MWGYWLLSLTPGHPGLLARIPALRGKWGLVVWGKGEEPGVLGLPGSRQGCLCLLLPV